MEEGVLKEKAQFLLSFLEGMSYEDIRDVITFLERDVKKRCILISDSSD